MRRYTNISDFKNRFQLFGAAKPKQEEQTEYEIDKRIVEINGRALNISILVRGQFMLIRGTSMATFQNYKPLILEKWKAKKILEGCSSDKNQYLISLLQIDESNKTLILSKRQLSSRKNSTILQQNQRKVSQLRNQSVFIVRSGYLPSLKSIPPTGEQVELKRQSTVLSRQLNHFSQNESIPLLSKTNRAVKQPQQQQKNNKNVALQSINRKSLKALQEQAIQLAKDLYKETTKTQVQNVNLSEFKQKKKYLLLSPSDHQSKPVQKRSIVVKDNQQINEDKTRIKILPQENQLVQQPNNEAKIFTLKNKIQENVQQPKAHLHRIDKRQSSKQVQNKIFSKINLSLISKQQPQSDQKAKNQLQKTSTKQNPNIQIKQKQQIAQPISKQIKTAKKIKKLSLSPIEKNLILPIDKKQIKIQQPLKRRACQSQFKRIQIKQIIKLKQKPKIQQQKNKQTKKQQQKKSLIQMSVKQSQQIVKKQQAVKITVLDQNWNQPKKAQQSLHQPKLFYVSQVIQKQIQQPEKIPHKAKIMKTQIKTIKNTQKPIELSPLKKQSKIQIKKMPSRQIPTKIESHLSKSLRRFNINLYKSSNQQKELQNAILIKLEQIDKKKQATIQQLLSKQKKENNLQTSQVMNTRFSIKKEVKQTKQIFQVDGIREAVHQPQKNRIMTFDLEIKSKSKADCQLIMPTKAQSLKIRQTEHNLDRQDILIESTPRLMKSAYQADFTPSSKIEKFEFKIKSNQQLSSIYDGDDKLSQQSENLVRQSVLLQQEQNIIITSNPKGQVIQNSKDNYKDNYKYFKQQRNSQQFISDRQMQQEQKVKSNQNLSASKDATMIKRKVEAQFRTVVILPPQEVMLPILSKKNVQAQFTKQQVKTLIHNKNYLQADFQCLKMQAINTVTIAKKQMVQAQFAKITIQYNKKKYIQAQFSQNKIVVALKKLVAQAQFQEAKDKKSQSKSIKIQLVKSRADSNKQIQQFQSMQRIKAEGSTLARPRSSLKMPRQQVQLAMSADNFHRPLMVKTPKPQQKRQIIELKQNSRMKAELKEIYIADAVEIKQDKHIDII